MKGRKPNIAAQPGALDKAPPATWLPQFAKAEWARVAPALVHSHTKSGLFAGHWRINPPCAVANATRLGASQRSATRRSASHPIATQRLSRRGSPVARVRLARTVPLNDASVESRQAETGDRATAQAQQGLYDCAMTQPGSDADDVPENRGRSFHEMPGFGASAR